MRAKTKKRLVILLISMTLLIVLGVSAMVYREMRRDARHTQWLADGNAAWEVRNYREVVFNYGSYLRENRDAQDHSLKLKYALAQKRVPLADGSHLSIALKNFQDYLRQDPTNIQALTELGELLVAARQNEEALETAENLIKADPKAGKGYRIKVMALNALAMKKGAEAQKEALLAKALQTAEQLNKEQPKYLDGQTLTLQVLAVMGKPKNEIFARAQALKNANPDDPHFDLLMSWAHLMNEQPQEAEKAIRQALARKIDDQQFNLDLLEGLDMAGLFSESLQLLAEIEKKAGPSKLLTDEESLFRHQYYHRLYQSGKYEDVVKGLAWVPDDSQAVDADLMGLKCLSLVNLKRRDETNVIVETLSNRTNDPSGAGWSLFMREGMKESNKPLQTIEACERSLKFYPGNPYVMFTMGNAYAGIGENDKAIEAWSKISELGKGAAVHTWIVPVMSIIETYNRTGRSEMAYVYSEQALRRFKHTGLFIQNLVAAKALMDSGKSSNAAKLKEAILLRCEALLKSYPSLDQALLIYLDIVIKDKKLKEAEAAINAALSSKSPPSQGTILQILRAADANKLNVNKDALTDKLTNDIEKREDQAKEAVEAFKLLREGKKDEGLKMLTDLRDQAPASEKLTWELNIAKYLEMARDGRAKDNWIALADRNVANTKIQIAAFEMASVQSDREYARKLVERIKANTGESGVQWRLYNAMWLMGSTQSSDLKKALETLDGVIDQTRGSVRPLELRALCLTRMGDYTRAIKEYEALTRLDPGNESFKFELARHYHVDGDFDKSYQLLVGILNTPNVSETRKRQIVQILVGQARFSEALQILTGVLNARIAPDLQLMQVYAMDNKPREALQCGELLMSQEKPSGESIGFYAELLAQNGRKPEGAAVLDKLRALELPPGVEASIRAGYFMRYGSPAEAETFLEAAATGLKTDHTSWLRLYQYHLAQGKVAEAKKDAQRAQEAMPSDTTFSLLGARAEQLGKAAANPELQPIVSSVLSGDRFREAGLEAIQIYMDAAETTLDAKLTPAESQKKQIQALRDITQLADRFPRFDALQNLVVNKQMRMGQFNDALARTQQTMQNQPNDATSARLATIVLGSMEKWDQMLATARTYKTRSARQPADADLFIAQALVQLKRPQEAIAQLDPYLSAALSNPTANERVVKLYLAALVINKEVDKAANILKPLIAESQPWRLYWMEFATHTISDRATTIAWLDRVEQTIPPGAIRDRYFLGRAWQYLAEREKDKKINETALKVYHQTAAIKEVTPDILFSMAVLVSQMDYPKDAVELYRAALKLKGDQPEVLNNLAIMLVDHNLDAQEALKYATEAVRLKPDEANYYDTLAYIQRKTKDFKGSVENLKKATELQPNHPLWAIHLGLAHLDVNDVASAKKMLSNAEALMTRAGAVPPEWQKKLEELRQNLASASAKTGQG